jgi:hypothetical protein
LQLNFLLGSCQAKQRQTNKTWQELRQGDGLSTLIFNVVLASIERRAKLQTDGTIFDEKRRNKVGLKINESKTKHIRDVGQSVTFGDIYLGSLVTPNNDVSLEIQRRIHTANRCFLRLRKQLQLGHLSRPTKFIVYKTLIRPVLLYGSETGVLTKREENQLLVLKRKMLEDAVSLTL